MGNSFQRVCVCVCREEGREFYKEKHYLLHFMNNNNNIKFKELGLFSTSPSQFP